MLTRSRTSSTRLTGISNLAVTAPIKPGFVKGFETITYVDRLGKLLNALNQARVTARESWLQKPPFPDSVARFDIIQNFRYAIIPPAGEGPLDPVTALKNPGQSRLSLNVTFDAGWEPYMRVIYRDIGTLLDALFCHCEGYPGSRTSPFDEYCTWVRNNELAEGLLYADSATTLGDRHYFDRLDRIQRAETDPVVADRRIAELAVEPSHKQIANALAAARKSPRPSFFSAMRAIKGFYRLSAYFQPNAADESGILIRFAQAVLGEFHTIFNDIDNTNTKPYQDDPALAPLINGLFAEELAWFNQKQTPPSISDRLTFDPARLQAGVAAGYKNVSHGCVVLLRVEKDRGVDAARFLAGFPVSTPKSAATDPIKRNVALTYAGLEALGLAAERLSAFPQEFFEGMEKRASLLGDVHTNHPDNWNRPQANWPLDSPPQASRIDLSTVHVVVLLRLTDLKGTSAALHANFKPEIDKLGEITTGLKVLSVQPMRSERIDADTSREHFGFLDGVSQPDAQMYQPSDKRPRDQVAAGELLLGYRNDRGDAPHPALPDPLFDDGSFLVMRKLQQNVGLLDEVIPNEADVESLMGRKKDGTPLVLPALPKKANNYTFESDPTGLQCPFHAHVRRANPRDGRPYTPRLFRRGMSYGPRWKKGDTGTERGLVFMAYCGSIAEQFEVVQRWIAGGNSTGVSSSQSDPFLGVPDLDETRTFRFPQGKGVTRIDLGARPFVTLQWGLYLFAPSLAALKSLPDLLQKAPALAPAPKPADLSFETWQNLLEDTSADRNDTKVARNATPWRYVREQENSVLATGYGLLVGNQAGVLDVLQDNGRRFSVNGYGQRMSDSIGLGFLGLDPAAGHDEQAEHQPNSVNAAIEDYTQEIVFNEARPQVDDLLAKLEALGPLEGLKPSRIPIDLVSLCEAVLANLCFKWFGLPDKALMWPGGRTSDPLAPPRCPGHLLTTSRFIFGPHPNERVIVEASSQGLSVLEAVKALVKQKRLGELARKIQDRLQHIQSVQDGDKDFLVARTIAGVMLGFPPTVEGNFLRTMDTLIKTEELWKLQQLLLEKKNSVADPLQRAQEVLFEPLIATMRKRPLPEMIWRTAGTGASVGGVAPTDKDQRVVLGLASAVSDPQADHYLMFGGQRTGAHKTVHACPGYHMAIGVLLGLLSGLMEAGELRPTGSGVSLTLLQR
jgi:Dyp-type peroxidase family